MSVVSGIVQSIYLSTTATYQNKLERAFFSLMQVPGLNLLVKEEARAFST
jgi:hypothetical protein